MMTSYFEQTLERITTIANDDVEMRNVAPFYLVIDTNVMLDHFEAVKQFVDDAERLGLPVVVVLPGAVVIELDRQKEQPKLMWLARRASSWLLAKLKERRTVKVQAHEETCKKSGSWNRRDRDETAYGGSLGNDMLILDCAMHFQRLRPTVLCSGDNNLCIASQAQGIPTVSPTAGWTSRQMIRALFSDVDDDGETVEAMDVDEEAPELARIHLLDRLHEQVVDYFVPCLFELARRLGAPEADGLASQHALRPTEDIGDCIAWLAEQGAPKRQGSPRLDSFLAKKGTRTGARWGRDWARRDWEVALEDVPKIGLKWKDGAITEGLNSLAPHFEQTFLSKMRPL